MPENENQNEQSEQDQPVEQQAGQEELAAEVASEEVASEEVATSDEDSSSTGSEEVTPEASFSSLVTFVAAQTVVALGEGGSDPGGNPAVRLDIARYHIDTLVVLEEKTQGHLSEEEGALLEQYLHQLRMLYVSVQQKDGPPAE